MRQQVRLPGGLRLREARDDDADQLVALIGDVYAEYPGCVLDLDGVDQDLHAIATWTREHDGEFWVAVDGDGAVAASVGWTPSDAGVELKRLYVRADVRGKGVGTWLARHVEATARRHDADAVEAWSDSRFTDAHRLYEQLGYERRPETRELHDPSDTTELHFVRALPPRHTVAPADVALCE